MDQNAVITVHILHTGLLSGHEERLLGRIAPCYALKYRRMKCESAKKQELGAGFLLAKHLDVLSDEALFFNESGKPFLKRSETAPSPPEFSLSHAGDYVVLAVSKEPVGVDIERADRVKLSVLKCVLPAKMYERLEAQDTAEEEKTFHRGKAWTSVEAVLKAEGCGLFAELRKDPGFMECWHLESFRMDGGHVISVASAHPFHLRRITEKNAILA